MTIGFLKFDRFLKVFFVGAVYAGFTRLYMALRSFMRLSGYRL